MRCAKLVRKTNETSVEIEINLDGKGKFDIATGIGFFDHMLEQLSFHSLIDMKIKAHGDTHIDDHHSVEDTGLALGQAISQALGDKKGICRYGSSLLPMDEALARVALDFSSRPYLCCNIAYKTQKIGQFDCELVREFFKSLSSAGGLTLHIAVLSGENSHHIVEACFKALALALRQAVSQTDSRLASTKGIL